jgi:two-component system CheB/CheR fusion protein
MKKKPVLKRPTSTRKKPSAEIPVGARSFYVVGLGASAGGLDALERFFHHMPEHSGMAFFVVSHLDPNHVSIMPELIQKSTPMKVLQAVDGIRVEPDCVYVAPANRDVAILHGIVQLIEPIEAHGFRLPIDYFFKSLAADSGEKAICIILSGMASDGCAGLKAVKSELGMVMVQDPASAKYDSMPSNAIKTDLVDYILPPEEMPDQLLKYTKQKVKGVLLDRAITEGKIPDTFQKIFILLRNRTGHDFSQYKQNTVYRRVERRISISQLDNLPHYVRMLQENPAEIETLFKELLIGVTSFFRDPDAFVKLKEVLMELVKSKPDNGQIRIWVPGCSTGEEAYSIAIALRECMNEVKKNLYVQIFATDIDTSAIDKARIATFSGIASDVSKERLDRFFTSDGHVYHVRKEIREMLIFAQQSVTKDPPFTKLDMITCRNLLIYFNTELQKKIIPIFHYSLQPKGILFLGSSETINSFVDLFSIVDNKWKIYRKRDSMYSAQPFLDFPSMRMRDKTKVPFVKKVDVTNITQVAEKVLLQQATPNCLIVTDHGDIIYIHGKIDKYLALSHGEAKMNIFEMARGGLQQELPVLIRKAVATKKTVSVEGVKISAQRVSYFVNCTVQYITEPLAMAGSLIVLFEDLHPNTKRSPVKSTHRQKKSERIIKELEHELKSTKENLRTVVEELETSNEELKSSNEEMQSTNEEMQSSNEELETSKEELQSLNEELITVNTELQNKNDELSVVNSDMKNLLDSNDIPTIFLDTNLCIKRFTQHAVKVVNLIGTDVGRPIDHLAAKFKYDKLVEDAKGVLKTLLYKQTEVQTNDGLWYQMRILPYRTTTNVIDGVVITFSDINQLKKTAGEIAELNKEVQRAREYADNIIDTVRESLIILDKDLKVVSANRSFYRSFKTDRTSTVGKYIYEIDGKKWDLPTLRKLLKEILLKQNVFENFAMEYDFTGDGKKSLLLNCRQIFHGTNDPSLILLAIEFQNNAKGVSE